ncbi:MAG TPA: GDP-L-fucose synthase [Myxococcales bacterium]|nr:GDP-L-fucose synthase [Myxococcales bacterium]HIN86550.1 GDP-L-fucose synthase [Myxococcales bacterium]
MNLSQSTVLVTGGRGFLGSKVCEYLRERGVLDVRAPSSSEFDLRYPEACKQVVQGVDLVVHLAAKVGGIGLNREKPGELFYDNLIMGVQLMEEARLAGVSKFLTVGTICAYPKFTPVPFKEETLWDGYPEETNAPYGVAKKALLVMGQAYRAQYDFNAVYTLPVNLYGPNDNFDPRSSHVIPALLKKVYDAQELGSSELVCWGDGSPTREFLYVDDAAAALVAACERLESPEPVNIGADFEISIKELMTLIADLMGYDGKIVWDTSKPNGQPRRRLDVSRAREWLGWEAQTGFKEGLRRTIDWYREHPLPVQKPEW